MSTGVRAPGTFTLGKNTLHKNSSLVPMNICCFPGGGREGPRPLMGSGLEVSPLPGRASVSPALTGDGRRAYEAPTVCHLPLSVACGFLRTCGQAVLLSFLQVRKLKGERLPEGEVTQGKGRAWLSLTSRGVLLLVRVGQPPHPSTHPPTHPLTHSSTHPPTYSPTHSPTHFLIHPHTHPLTHPPIHPSVLLSSFLFLFFQLKPC